LPTTPTPAKTTVTHSQGNTVKVSQTDAAAIARAEKAGAVI
jgi:hypothetical protein